MVDMIKPQVSLRLFLFLFVYLKAHRARILEVAVEFKRYVEAAVLVFVDVYLPNQQSDIGIADVGLQQHLVQQFCCGNQLVTALFAEFVELPTILYLLRQLRYLRFTLFNH